MGQASLTTCCPRPAPAAPWLPFRPLIPLDVSRLFTCHGHSHPERASSVRAGTGSVLGVALPLAHSRCSINTCRMLTGIRKPGSGLCSGPKQVTGLVTRSLSACSLHLGIQQRSPVRDHTKFSHCKSFLCTYCVQVLVPAYSQYHMREGRQCGVGGIPCRHTRTDARGSGHSVGRGSFSTWSPCHPPTSPCSL